MRFSSRCYKNRRPRVLHERTRGLVNAMQHDNSKVNLSSLFDIFRKIFLSYQDFSSVPFFCSILSFFDLLEEKSTRVGELPTITAAQRRNPCQAYGTKKDASDSASVGPNKFGPEGNVASKTSVWNTLPCNVRKNKGELGDTRPPRWPEVSRTGENRIQAQIKQSHPEDISTTPPRRHLYGRSRAHTPGLTACRRILSARTDKGRIRQEKKLSGSAKSKPISSLFCKHTGKAGLAFTE